MPLNTYPPHYLLQWGGTLFTNEIWSNSMRLLQNTGQQINSARSQEFLADFEADLTAFMNSGIFGQGTKATYAKFNAIAPTGKYVSDTESNSRFFAAPIVGTGIQVLPPQIAVAATFLTASDRGLANKGRIFLAGMSGTNLGTDAGTGLIASNGNTIIRDAVAAFVTAVNNNPGFDAEFGGLDVHVVSQGNAFLPGVARKVTGVKVGRVWDTQRRRRNQLDELYSPPAAVS